MNSFVSCLVTVTGLILGQDAVDLSARKPDASDVFFEKGTIPELRIRVSDGELEKLKAENRKYVRCTIVENGKTTFKNMAIKLKGAAGSFREFDDRPALTFNSSKFNKGQSFHAMNKFHLNNSVQDETYVHEWLCQELFRQAGVPAPRVTHARVWLNDRDVGLYVLKEGFDKTFLERHFEDPDGNLYDGGFVQDIDQELEKDAGEGPDDHSDLTALVEACREPNLEERWRRVEELLDVDAFITFMAMELMTCHWDGYTQNSNNYRLYFNPTDKKAHFFPHGMDQMFGDPGASILEYPGPIVSSTVMQNSEWRAKYRKRVASLLPLFDPADKLQARVDVLRDRLQPVLAAIDPQIARDHVDRVKELNDRLAARAESLKEQNERHDPDPAEFDENGMLKLADWYTASESEDAVIEEIDLPGDMRAYTILCGPSGQCVASWRRKVILMRGNYTFHANVQTKDVAAIEDDKGSAAGVRVSGAQRTNTLDGTSTEWQTLQFEFTVEEDRREVELVAELRTTRGRVWFDAKSLYLTRTPAEEEK
jgi:hypothetical protein